MEHLATSDFSQNQKDLIELRFNKNSYNKIIEAMNRKTGFNTSPQQIVTCLLRSAMGHHWDYITPTNKTNAGNLPYLCKDDFEILKDNIKSAAELGSAYDTLEVLDEATRLKGQRLAFGIAFLDEINCPELRQRLANQVVLQPSRSWINWALDDLECFIKSRREVDQKRLEACSYQVIDAFYLTYANIIQTTDPILLFTADETMIETKIRRKAVVPAATRVVLDSAYPDMPHLSGMMCTNVFGTGPPPMIILSELQNCPDELKVFAENKQCWIGSTSSGFMTKDMFLLWVICYVNWMSEFRMSLPTHIRERKALLIMDGHSSRACPLALLLLRKANIELLILPSHTTHVLQLFDVGLANPLKTAFSPLFRKVLKEATNNPSLPTNASKLRYSAVMGFLDAWKATCTHKNCLSAAKAVGLYPFDPQAPKQSVFVRDLTQAEQDAYNERQRRNAGRLAISNTLITDANFIVSMASETLMRAKFAHLCNLQEYMRMRYSEVVRTVLNRHDNALLLTRVPPFYSPTNPPIFF